MQERYRAIERLYAGAYMAVYRARVVDTDAHVLIKVPQEVGDHARRATLRREKSVIERLGIECWEGDGAQVGPDVSAVLVTPDPGGAPLATRLGVMDVAGALAVAEALASALQTVHHRRLIHKDINPGNVLVRDDGGVSFASYDLAVQLPREAGDIVHPEALEGRLPYVSPEQTGRMNRVTDYRTDFYSLGATLYALTTGAPPFETQDAVELVHAHIARPPTPPAAVGVPAALSDLILKLLAKNAEDRYQSAAGILADLQECSRRLVEHGEIGSFALGDHDVSDVFQVPQKLYGREAELDAVLSAFDRVADGASEVLMVSGYSGIGKSALVRETYRPVVARRGMFIAGKHDQYQRNVPYAGVASAVAELVRQMLTESAEGIAARKAAILAALGENAQVLIDLVPELELIIGEQPPVDHLAPDESEARFTTLITHFVGVFAGDDSPLVMFLDDLQWSDRASLKLIRHLATAPHGMRLLLVGAYRDNEVGPAHPLALALHDLEAAGVTPTRVTLAPLPLSAVLELVADALSSSPDKVRPLAELLSEKTGGNPFFLLQFFSTVYEEGILEYSIDARQWRWDLAAIDGLESTENVVDLMIKLLKRLPAETQAALQVASCVGNRFPLSTLARILTLDYETALGHVWPAVQSGHVISPRRSDQAGSYRFLHDRVQQAAYQLIEEGERRSIHHRIGHHLWRNQPEHAVEEHLFDICGHLNQAAELLTDAERIELADLNLLAGRRAMAASAHGSAHAFIRAGIDQLGADGWEARYDTAMALHLELSECEYSLENTEAARTAFDEVLSRARTTTEKVRVYVLQSQLYRHHAQYREALDSCITGLGLLGVDIPAPDELERLGELVGAAGAELGGKLAEHSSIAGLADLPVLTDPARLLEADLLEELSVLAMFFTPLLAGLSTMKLVLLSLEHGNSRASAVAYASHGTTISTAAGLYDLGYQFGRLGMDLARQNGDQVAESKVAMWLGALTCHWTQHVDEGIRVLKEGVELGVRIGATVWASYCAFFTPVAVYHSGANLELARDTLNRYMVPMGAQSMSAAICYQHLIDGLTGQLPGRWVLSHGDFDEDAHAQSLVDAGQALALQHYFSVKLAALVHFGRFEEAVAVCERAAEQGDITMVLFGQIASGWFPFYKALALLDRAGQVDEETAAGYLSTAEALAGRLDTFAAAGPANFTHMAALVAAEQARLAKDQLTALDKYDAAVAAARAGRFVQDEALALERLARFHLAHGRTSSATRSLRGAHERYSTWGAMAKVAALEEEFPELLGASGVGGGAATRSSLDFASVLKASRALSGEIELQALLDRAMEVLIENAGAQRGLLLLDEGGELQIAASSDKEDLDYPQTVVEYCRRTGSPVVLAEATGAELFQKDPYIAERRPRSVLAAPISKQQRQMGVLYMENDLSAGAFTRGRVEVLEALSSQVAVSIENARLYESQREQAESFSRFVPKEFLQHLGKASITEVKRGDAVRRDFTVLFSDLRDFTTLSESLSASDNLETLNAYLEHMEPIIQRYRGFVDKYIGDAIMALFPSSPEDAARAAVEMARALADHNMDRAARGEGPLRMGVGVHTGMLVLGTLGSGNRLETTVVGDTVNVASRIEGQTRRFGSSLLVSAETLRNARTRFATRRVGRIRVKGRKMPISMVEVLDAEPGQRRAARMATLADFDAAADRFYAGDLEGARAGFEGCLARVPDDLLVQAYLARCDALAGRDWSTANEDWDVDDIAEK